MTLTFTNVLTVNIANVPVSDQGREVYKAILKTGARSTEELQQHLDMSEGMINLMLAHLYSFDLIKIDCDWEPVIRDEWLNGQP